GAGNGCRWQGLPEGQHGFTVGVHDTGVGDLELFLVGERGGLRVAGVDTHELDLELLLLDLLSHRLQRRRLFPARWTPGTPDVEHHHLARGVRELELTVLVEVGGAELRRRFAVARFDQGHRAVTFDIAALSACLGPLNLPVRARRQQKRYHENAQHPATPWAHRHPANDGAHQPARPVLTTRLAPATETATGSRSAAGSL